MLTTDGRAAEATANRKAAKAKNNTAGKPIQLPSKILAIISDPYDRDGRSVYVAESAGLARHIAVPSIEEQVKAVNVDVGKHEACGTGSRLVCSKSTRSDGSMLFDAMTGLLVDGPLGKAVH